MLKEMTQLERIEWHLNKFGNIDQKQAIKLYGDYRLSDKILKLRRKEYNIESKRIPCRSRYGTKTEYVRYELKKTNA
jgi:hypothetical protein